MRERAGVVDGLVRGLFGKAVALVAGVCLMVQCMGCSFLGPQSQTLNVSSDPSGAEVTVNGELLGPTPVQHKIRRKSDVVVQIHKAGYRPVTRHTTRQLSDYGVADIIGGVFLLVPFVGLLSDGAWKQEPHTIHVRLIEE
jgi:hypothetical protein